MGVMAELNGALQVSEGVPENVGAAMKSLIRDLLTSQLLNCGMVFPRVTVEGWQRTRFALGRAAEPLRWRASRLAPIELVILVVEPSSSGQCKRLRAALMQLSNDPICLGELKAACGAGEMLAVLQRIPVDEPRPRLAEEASMLRFPTPMKSG